MKGEKLYTYVELVKKLTEFGNELIKEQSIFVVGGYCMLRLGARDTTSDIDCITDGIVIPREHMSVLNSDISHIADINLDYKTLLTFSRVRESYGKLNVYLASAELLLAMKFLARQGRTKERDAIDLMFLSEIADKNKAYAALQVISNIRYSRQEFLDTIESEVWIIKHLANMSSANKLNLLD